MKKIKMTAGDLDKLREDIMAVATLKKGLPEKLSFDVNPSVTLKEEEKVEVCFENTAFKKMKALINQCGKEIGWYGTVERDGERKFIIKDILVCPQIVTGSTVNTDDDAFFEWEQGLSDDEFTAKKFYGHSHVNMGVSPSGVDLTYQDDLLQNVDDFYIFGIFNKHGAHWLNIYDVKNNTLYEDKDIRYTYYQDENEVWAEEMIKERLREPKPAIPFGGTKSLKGKGGGVSNPYAPNYYNGYSGYGAYGAKGEYDWDRYGY